jgi:hypothetical protein
MYLFPRAYVPRATSSGPQLRTCGSLAASSNVKIAIGLHCEPRPAEGSNVACELSEASFNQRKDPQSSLRP